jgi:hypothetical protein
MRKFSFAILLLSLIMGLSLTGCLKADSINLDPNGATTIINMEYLAGSSGTTIGSGLTYFGGGALTYPPTDEADTATISVILAGGAILDKDVTVTIGPDANALLDNYSKDSIAYVAMPDSVYHLISNTATIPAGSSGALFQVVFYPSKIDPTQNFMLPLTVTDAAGYTVSKNFGHVYLHTIGNPIAGSYNQEWIRYNTADTLSGNPAFDEDLGPVIFAPTNPTTIEVESGTGVLYILSFTNNNGVLSDFNVSLDPESVTSAAVTITGGPVVVVADPINGIYRFNFTYLNSAGAARNITDQFVR